MNTQYDRAAEILDEWANYKKVHYDRRFAADDTIELDMAKSNIETLARVLREDILAGNDQHVQEDVEILTYFLGEFKNKYIIDILSKPTNR